MHTTRRLLHTTTIASGEGFAALHQRHAGRVALWASLHLSPALRAWLPVDDLVQDVWTRAYAAFPSFDRARGDFRAWLFGIAYNVLREHLRSMRVRQVQARATLIGDVQREPVDPATSIVSLLAAGDERSVLATVLAELVESDRRLVLWRGIEELPYAEIGTRLGLSAVAVESRWRRLLDRLRQRLPRSLCADRWLADLG